MLQPREISSTVATRLCAEDLIGECAPARGGKTQLESKRRAGVSLPLGRDRTTHPITDMVDPAGCLAELGAGVLDDWPLTSLRREAPLKTPDRSRGFRQATGREQHAVFAGLDRGSDLRRLHERRCPGRQHGCGLSAPGTAVDCTGADRCGRRAGRRADPPLWGRRARGFQTGGTIDPKAPAHAGRLPGPRAVAGLSVDRGERPATWRRRPYAFGDQRGIFR